MCFSLEMCLHARPPPSTSTCPAQRRNPGELWISFPTNGKEVEGLAQLESWLSNCLIKPNDEPHLCSNCLVLKTWRTRTGGLFLVTELKCSYTFSSCILHGCIPSRSKNLNVLSAVVHPSPSEAGWCSYLQTSVSNVPAQKCPWLNVVIMCLILLAQKQPRVNE